MKQNPEDAIKELQNRVNFFLVILAVIGILFLMAAIWSALEIIIPHMEMRDDGSGNQALLISQTLMEHQILLVALIALAVAGTGVIATGLGMYISTRATAYQLKFGACKTCKEHKTQGHHETTNDGADDHSEVPTARVGDLATPERTGILRRTAPSKSPLHRM